MIHTRTWFVRSFYCLFISIRVTVYTTGCVSATFPRANTYIYINTVSESTMAHHIYRCFTEKISEKIYSRARTHIHIWIEKGSECKNLFTLMSFVLYHDNLHVKLSECEKKWQVNVCGRQIRVKKRRRRKLFRYDPKWFMEKKVKLHKSTAKNDFLYLE